MPPTDSMADQTADNPDAWRPLVAALARPHSREAAARLLLGATLDDAVAPIPAAKRERVVETLRAAGLVDPSTGRFDETLAPRILAANRVVPREDVDRYLVDHELLERRADGSEYALVSRSAG